MAGRGERRSLTVAVLFRLLHPQGDCDLGGVGFHFGNPRFNFDEASQTRFAREQVSLNAGGLNAERQALDFGLLNVGSHSYG
jgi:hypothetical protein